MDRLDTMISEALDDEDREILAKIGREQPLSEMTLDLFRGRLGWLNAFVLAGRVIFGLIAIYAVWQCFTLTEVVDVVRWGLVAVVLVMASLILRVTLYLPVQTNRVLRALKYLEMQVALLASKR